MNFKTLLITPLLFYFFATAFIHAQNPVELIKLTTDRIVATPYIQNLTKHKGLSLYENAQEGMQIATVNGRFGYLNKVMDWQIPPQYDYAFSFNEGLGIAFLNGQACYIDKNGKQPFNTEFAKDLAPFQNGRALFRTHSGKIGLFDKQGHLIIDTIYDKINAFVSSMKGYNGISVKPQQRAVTIVKQLRKKTEYGLIDTSGKLLVPLGIYTHIELIDNVLQPNMCFFKATNPQFLTLYDTKGSEVFRLKEDSTRAFQVMQPMQINEGMIVVRFASPIKNKENTHDDEEDEKDNDSYIGLINFKGEMILNDTNSAYIQEFDDKYAFVSDKKGDEKIIDLRTKEGVKISPIPSRMPHFYELKLYGKGPARANTNLDKRKWGILDSCMTWIIPPIYDGIDLRHHERNEPYFEIHNDLDPETAKLLNIKLINEHMPARLVGIADIKGKIIFQPSKYRSLYPDSALQKFYFQTADGSMAGQIDRYGKILRKNDRKMTTTQTSSINQGSQTPKFDYSKIEWKINVDASNCNPDDKNIRNQLVQCNEYQRFRFEPETKTVHIVVDKIDSTLSKLNSNHSALKVKLINASKEVVYFTTKQHYLHIKIEAQDEQGQWREISSVRPLTPYEKTVKKSERTIALPPQYFWEIELPTFVGCIKTQFRCVIFSGKEGEKSIISETWEGSINPAQFWKTPFYDPNRVFDSLYGEE